MTNIIKWAPLLIALGLAGCAPNEKPMTQVKFIRLKVAPECLTTEPAWTNTKVVADPKPEPMADTAWREHANKGAFSSLVSDHATCRAALDAQQPKGSKKNG